MEGLFTNTGQRFHPVSTDIPKIYVIHENDEWVKPLWEELNLLNVPYENWFIDEGGWDLSDVPPEGVFYNRMSASAHTRGHRYAVELSLPLLTWLEAHGRRVINGAQTLQTEVNKARQYLLLNTYGIKTPGTYVVNSKSELLDISHKQEGAFIVKPNRGGKGLGVRLFHSPSALQLELESNPDFESLDGIYLIQEYIQSSHSEIVRMEFVDGKFYYAVAVDTSSGFELCPADACAIDDQFCPTTPGETEKPKFRILEDFQNPDIGKLESFLKDQRIDVAGIEFITDQDGKRFVYDINTNTNYNSDAEAATAYRWKGMRKLAEFLKDEFQSSYR